MRQSTIDFPHKSLIIWKDFSCDDIVGNEWKTGWVSISGQIQTQFNGSHLQSGAIIMQSNIIWYCIQHNSDRSRTYIRGNTHKRHPISGPDRGAMGYLLWGFDYELDHVIMAWHSFSYIICLEIHLCTQELAWTIRWYPAKRALPAMLTQVR